jgi:ABC-type transport system involved in cytochrome c biogenesis permease subunit
MRRFPWPLMGLALLLIGADSPASKLNGGGPGYETAGALPLMHHGRVKPLDTVAREEIKQLFGLETIKLKGPDGQVTQTWSPTAAYVDIQARPEVWDEQPIILVEYLPLKRVLLSGAFESRLKAIIDSPDSPAAAKSMARAIKPEEVNADELRALARVRGLDETNAKGLNALADTLAEDHKRLTPRELQEGHVHVDGKHLDFAEWWQQLATKKAAAGEDNFTTLEDKAIEVGGRLAAYQILRDRQIRSNPILIFPRPYNEAALKFTAKAYDAGVKSRGKGLSPLQMEAAESLLKYWNDIQIDDRAMPGTDAKFDARFSAWMKDNSAWVPLKTILDSKPEDLVEAGFPGPKVEAFRAAFKAFEAAEQSSPGAIGVEPARTLVDSAREVGLALNASAYPVPEAVVRELTFNSVAPFYKAQYAYGLGLVLLMLALPIKASKTSVGRLGQALYATGMAGFLAGIGLEIYGFYLRVMISGWAPVTNMYETVVWVALVTAVLGLVFELIYRRRVVAAAASGLALLACTLAANVTLLDPNIKSLQPVLRSNYWLVIHVLSEVSSYAAFALAMGLGMIGTTYYLTATYRRSPSFTSLLLPLIPGIPLLALGWTGVQAAGGAYGTQYINDGLGFYLVLLTAVVGGVLTGAGLFAPLGEIINRIRFRDDVETGAELVAGEGPSTGAPVASTNPVIAEIRARAAAEGPAVKLDSRGLAMQATASVVKPLANYIYRTMQVGVLLIAAGTILGGVWADYSWGRFWGWDPKEVWALITLLIYLVPLHGRFAGWVNTFTLTIASVACFMSVLMAWYGVNFVLGVGLHSYGFAEKGGQGVVMAVSTGMLSYCGGAVWRRRMASVPHHQVG